MRLHPGVGFPLERYVPQEGAIICGKNLPGGTIVSMSAPVVHHDRSVFGSDTDAFRPERWLEASSEQVKAMDRSFLAVSFPNPYHVRSIARFSLFLRSRLTR